MKQVKYNLLHANIDILLGKLHALSLVDHALCLYKIIFVFQQKCSPKLEIFLMKTKIDKMPYCININAKSGK